MQTPPESTKSYIFKMYFTEMSVGKEGSKSFTSSGVKYMAILLFFISSVVFTSFWKHVRAELSAALLFYGTLLIILMRSQCTVPTSVGSAMAGCIFCLPINAVPLRRKKCNILREEQNEHGARIWMPEIRSTFSFLCNPVCHTWPSS